MPRDLNVVSYNISWAIGKNETKGSEKQFIQDHTCFEQDTCYENQIESIRKLSSKRGGIDILCLQESTRNDIVNEFPGKAHRRGGELVVIWDKRN